MTWRRLLSVDIQSAKYAFIEAHRFEFSVRSMCRVLAVHFSGFYAWLKEPLSARAHEDARQTELIHQAWTESRKIYSYRKLTDDLRGAGETYSENRVARLASLAAIDECCLAAQPKHVDMYGLSGHFL